MSEQEEQGQSLVEILEELIGLVSEARSVPMSASVMVNRSQVLDLLETARDIVPDQIVQADGLLARADTVAAQAQEEGEHIVQRAHQDAEDIIQEARQQASRLVSQDAVTIAAKAQAQRILDEATSQAEKLRQGADEYSDSTLATLQNDVAELGGGIEELVASVQGRVDQLVSQIRAGRAVLAERQSDEEESWT
jgi:cell division septum initiation protein DivIVA